LKKLPNKRIDCINISDNEKTYDKIRDSQYNLSNLNNKHSFSEPIKIINRGKKIKIFIFIILIQKRLLKLINYVILIMLTIQKIAKIINY